MIEYCVGLGSYSSVTEGFRRQFPLEVAERTRDDSGHVVWMVTEICGQLRGHEGFWGTGNIGCERDGTAHGEVGVADCGLPMPPAVKSQDSLIK